MSDYNYFNFYRFIRSAIVESANGDSAKAESIADALEEMPPKTESDFDYIIFKVINFLE